MPIPKYRTVVVAALSKRFLMFEKVDFVLFISIEYLYYSGPLVHHVTIKSQLDNL